MAWSTPNTESVATIITATKWNVLVNNLRYLYGLDGTITFANSAVFTGQLRALSTDSGAYATGLLALGDARGDQVYVISQRPNTGNGAQIIIQNKNASNVVTDAARVTENQYWGFGTTSPLRKMHIVDGGGHIITGYAANVAGSDVSVLPAGSITNAAAVFYFIRSTDNAFFQGSISMALNASGALVTGTDAVSAVIPSDGSMVIRRTSGTRTWNAIMWIMKF